jgi:hypothetical protein
MTVEGVSGLGLSIHYWHLLVNESFCTLYWICNSTHTPRINVILG